MRLIDADEIEFSVARYPIGAYSAEYEFVSKYQIENEPTVKAIPIEWVRKYLTKRNNELEFDDLDYPDPLFVGEIVGIETMLGEWENENGTDRQE